MIQPASGGKLTPREIEVCRLLVLGWENKAIGEELGISRRTVEDHRRNIFRKYRCHKVIELARIIYDLGEPDFTDSPGVAESPQGDFKTGTAQHYCTDKSNSSL